MKKTPSKFTRKSQCKDACSKVMLEKSPLKIYHLLRGLLLNLHSSEEGKTTYTRKKKSPGMELGGGKMGEDLENYSVSQFYAKD